MSSRFEGTVYRVSPDGAAEPFAHDLGVACGLAFARRRHAVCRRSLGHDLQRRRERPRATTFASLPPSVAAFHLAFGADDALYVAAPTLSSYDQLYRIAPDGAVTTALRGFGRPQGLAFDRRRHAVRRRGAGRRERPVPAAGRATRRSWCLPGRAWSASPSTRTARIVVCSNDTAYRLVAHWPDVASICSRPSHLAPAPRTSGYNPRPMSQLFQRKPIAALVEDTRRRAQA